MHISTRVAFAPVARVLEGSPGTDGIQMRRQSVRVTSTHSSTLMQAELILNNFQK